MSTAKKSTKKCLTIQPLSAKEAAVKLFDVVVAAALYDGIVVAKKTSDKPLSYSITWDK